MCRRLADVDRRAVPIAWRPLAQHLAQRFAPAVGHDSAGTEALTRVAMAAMSAAAPDRNALGQDFTATVIPAAIRALRRHRREQIRRHALTDRPGPDLQAALVAAEEELGGRGNGSPTVAEVAAHLGVAEDHVVAALEAGWSFPDRPDAGFPDRPAAAAPGFSDRLDAAGPGFSDRLDAAGPGFSDRPNATAASATRAGSPDRSTRGTRSSGRS